MPINKNFIYKEIAGEYMLIPLEGNNMNMSKVFNLNEVGAFIYKKLLETDDINMVAEALTKEYEVDFNTAKADVDEYVLALKKRGIYE